MYRRFITKLLFFLAYFAQMVLLLTDFFRSNPCKGKGKSMDTAIYISALVIVVVPAIVCITKIIGGK
jgi:uncharacterized membrane protein YcjF (UPF0283 family)